MKRNIDLESLLVLHSHYVFRGSMLPEAAAEIEVEWREALRDCQEANAQKPFEAVVMEASIPSSHLGRSLQAKIVSDDKGRFERGSDIISSPIKRIQWDQKGLIVVTANTKYLVDDGVILLHPRGAEE